MEGGGGYKERAQEGESGENGKMRPAPDGLKLMILLLKGWDYRNAHPAMSGFDLTIIVGLKQIG
jgi:hypothetical protein